MIQVFCVLFLFFFFLMEVELQLSNLALVKKQPVYVVEQEFKPR